VQNVNNDQLMAARVGHAEFGDRPDVHGDKQIVARVGVTPAAGTGTKVPAHVVDNMAYPLEGIIMSSITILLIYIDN